MNIFKLSTDFLYHREEELPVDSFCSFFRQAKQIRTLLGKKGYLLDRYLSIFFDADCQVLAYEAVDAGFNASVEYQALCYSVIRAEENNSHPLYREVFKSFEEQSITEPYQESLTQAYMLYLPLADKFLAHALQLFIEASTDALDDAYDNVEINDLYKVITNITGTAGMDKLNSMLRQQFLISPITSLFLQGFSNDLLFKLIHHDKESSKQIFQLYLDAMDDPL